jgi:hypothetical protein
MTKAEINSLERQVEDARRRLAGDLSRLRSPAAIEEFKENVLAEASERKDALLAKSKQAASGGLQRLMDDVKHRAAANPTAAAMIGAGLAWRLWQRPPIASLLVGMGVWSLWRENPAQQRPDGFASRAEALARKAGQSLGEFATQASAVTEQASRSAAETAASLKGAASTAAERAADAAAQLRDETMERARRASWALQDVGSEETARDKLLLGAAAVAVTAAVGIAAQQRIADGQAASGSFGGRRSGTRYSELR